MFICQVPRQGLESLARNTRTLKRPLSLLERALALSREINLPAVEEINPSDESS
jgi:hypothetical protein